jgi:MerR HTH family regulatory protein
MDLRTHTFRAAQVCAVAGVGANTLKAWVGRGLLKLEEPDQTGWTRYSYRDLLRVCAWAEVNRAGISPVEAKRLVYEVEGHLEIFAFEGVPSAMERRGCFILAEAWEPGEGNDGDKSLLNVYAADFAQVKSTLQESMAGRNVVSFATVILVDTLKLWRRIEAALKAAPFASSKQVPDAE